MAHYTCDPRAELIGQTAMSLLTNLQHDEIEPILEKHGLTNIDAKQWYPVQKVLDVFNDITEQPEAMWDFVAVGMAAGDLGYRTRPAELKDMTLEQYLMAYAVNWKNRHRNLDPEGIKPEKIGAKHIRITLNVPYPDDVFYGIFYAYARNFLPKGTNFTVKYDENVPRKEQGGDVTIIHVSWE